MGVRSLAEVDRERMGRRVTEEDSDEDVECPHCSGYGDVDFVDGEYSCTWCGGGGRIMLSLLALLEQEVGKS